MRIEDTERGGEEWESLTRHISNSNCLFGGSHFIPLADKPARIISNRIFI